MVGMAKARSSSPVVLAVAAAFAALVFACGLALAAGIIRLPPPSLIETSGQVTARHTALDPAPIGRQYLPPPRRNFLGYSFTDEAGVTYSGQVEVSIVQYERYAVGDTLTLFYAPSDKAAVSIESPAVKEPAQLHLSAIFLLLSGLAELVLVDRLAKALGFKGYL